jgi:hypothetical protein
MTESLVDHKIVSESEWVEARKSLLKKEKEFTILRDQLSQQRRDLPWEAVNKEDVFEGENGKQTLRTFWRKKSINSLSLYVWSKLGGRMFALFLLGRQFQWNHCVLEPWGCDHDRCISGSIRQVGRVPEEDGLGFQVAFFLRYRFQFWLPRVIHAGRVGQERSLLQLRYTRTRQPTARRSERILQTLLVASFHIYSAYARGVDMLNVAYRYLDIVPKSRDEAGHKFPQFWVRRHDEYGKSISDVVTWLDKSSYNLNKKEQWWYDYMTMTWWWWYIILKSS